MLRARYDILCLLRVSDAAIIRCDAAADAAITLDYYAYPSPAVRP